MSTQKHGTAEQRQAPLQKHYRHTPADAWITDGASAGKGVSEDPFHGQLVFTHHPGVRLNFGIHRAVGGDHDGPNPGDLLSAALAACMHATTRIVAERLGVRIKDLKVNVTASVDVRGTLLVSPDVPVGFQTFHCRVLATVNSTTPAGSLQLLMETAEHCCVVRQTLVQAVPVEMEWVIDQALEAASG